MTEPTLLAIETSSATASLALAHGGAVAERRIATPREQTALALGLVDELLREAGLGLTDLDAIVFGQGPGSFTGLRVAAAIAQGLSLGSGRPIVPVSSLAALAARAFAELSPAAPADGAAAELRVLCCVDARMGEVYSATYALRDGLVSAVVDEAIGPPAALGPPAAPYLAVGDGFAAHAEPLAAVIAAAQAVDPALHPRARELLPLAADKLSRGEVVALESALPLYLRESGAWRSW